MQWLVAGAKPGDVLFFHFSGHGSQQRDDSGMEADGFNETICPCDYSRAGQIVDDEIWSNLVHPLPSGVRLTALMDCCHSGTGLDLPFTYDMRVSPRTVKTPFLAQGSSNRETHGSESAFFLLWSCVQDENASHSLGGPKPPKTLNPEPQSGGEVDRGREPLALSR